MKINNSLDINAITVEALKNKMIKPLLDIGQNTASVTTQPSSTPSQISQLLKSINVFPFLFHFTTKPSPLLSDLLSHFVMPTKPELAAKWLAEKQIDNVLLNALKQLSSLTNNTDENTTLKSTLMLIAEQKIAEGNKSTELNWIFPLNEQNLNPVKINIQRKNREKGKKTRWIVTINLTLSKNRQLTATATLERNNIGLSFCTDSTGLAKELIETRPKLEYRLNKHHLSLSEYDVSIVVTPKQEKPRSGLNIQV